MTLDDSLKLIEQAWATNSRLRRAGWSTVRTTKSGSWTMVQPRIATGLALSRELVFAEQLRYDPADAINGCGNQPLAPSTYAGGRGRAHALGLGYRQVAGDDKGVRRRVKEPAQLAQSRDRIGNQQLVGNNPRPGLRMETRFDIATRSAPSRWRCGRAHRCRGVGRLHRDPGSWAPARAVRRARAPQRARPGERPRSSRSSEYGACLRRQRKDGGADGCSAHRSAAAPSRARHSFLHT